MAHFRPNQATYGCQSPTSIGPQIWDGLPSELKSAENLKSFKVFIENGTVASANVVPVLAYELVCKFRNFLIYFFEFYIRF